MLGVQAQGAEGLSCALGHPPGQRTHRTARRRLRSAQRRASPSAVPALECHCCWLFFLPGNGAKPGGFINPSRRWAAVTGSRRKPFCSCAPKGAGGAREELEPSLPSVNCSRAHHLSGGNRKTPPKSQGTINDVRRCPLEKNGTADALLLGGNNSVRRFCRPVGHSV